MGKTYRNDSDEGWKRGGNRSKKKKSRDKRHKSNSPAYNKPGDRDSTHVKDEWLEDYYQEDFEKYKKKL
jgi:hypothetical protein